MKYDPFSQAIALYVMCFFLRNAIPCMSGLFGVYESYMMCIPYVLLVFGIVICFPFLLRGIPRRVILFMLVAFGVFGTGIIFFPQNREPFLQLGIWFMTNTIPIIVLFGKVEDYAILMNYLLRISEAIAWICLVIIATSPLGFFDSAWDGEYFGLGYGCLIPSLILLTAAIERKGRYTYLFGVMAFFILLYANRAPLASIGLYAVYYMIHWLNRNHMFRKRWVFVTVLPMIGILGALFWKRIAAIVYSMLLEMGLDSRTLAVASWENSSQNDLRGGIYTKTFEIIKSSPFTIRGIKSDVVVLGIYPHNLFLELVFQFGIVIGGLLSVIILGLVVRSLGLGKTGTQNSLIVVITMCGSLIPLMFSLSLWNNTWFWVWFFLITKKRV